ncbi:MAG: hypothetical protein ACTHU0_39265 [Kofleriaceae bacterium]
MNRRYQTCRRCYALLRPSEVINRICFRCERIEAEQAERLTTEERKSTHLDGQHVTRVQRVIWQPDDDRRIRSATIIGRGLVDVAGGGRFHGLVIMPQLSPGTPLVDLTHASASVVVWERSSSRFVAVPLNTEAE